MFLIFLLALSLTASFVKGGIYGQYYKQAYKIAESMSLQQKIGQTIQTDFYTLTDKNVSSPDVGLQYHIGCVYNAGYGCADSNGNMVDLTNLSDQELQRVYAKADVQSWIKLTDNCKYEEQITTKQGKKYVIRPFLGTNAMHGDQHVAGNIVFPHNIGISCSHNSENFYNMGYWTAKSMKRYGFNFVLAPTVAVSHNPQWGRYYQTMGQNHDEIYSYVSSFVQGLQGTTKNPTGIIACAKHFFADGSTFWGSDEGNAQVSNFTSFINHNVQGFKGGIEKGLGSVMVSYSAINFMPLAAGSFLGSVLRGDLDFDGFVLSDNNHISKLSQQRLPTSFQRMHRNQSIATMFAAGIDMQIIPPKAQMIQYIEYVKQGLQKNTIGIDRLNDAVAWILSVKLASGIVEEIKQSAGKPQQKNLRLDFPSHATTEYQDSLKAVHESLVLLKNQNVLPIKVDEIQYVVLVGQKIVDVWNKGNYRLFQNYDNIGMQVGGWTFQFQGFNGNTIWTGKNKQTSNASSILDALYDIKNNRKQNKNVNNYFKELQILYPQYNDTSNVIEIQEQRKAFLNKLNDAKQQMNQKNTVILAVLGESPYAQMVGDVNIPYCQNPQLYQKQGCIWYSGAYLPPKQPNSLELQFNNFQRDIINSVRQSVPKIPLISILISGRPMIINEVLNQSSAFINAFLPGTSGGHGILDSIIGNYIFRSNNSKFNVNTLSIDWPKSMQSLDDFPFYDSNGEIPRIKDPLFQVGYGLSTKQ